MSSRLSCGVGERKRLSLYTRMVSTIAINGEQWRIENTGAWNECHRVGRRGGRVAYEIGSTDAGSLEASADKGEVSVGDAAASVGDAPVMVGPRNIQLMKDELCFKGWSARIQGPSYA